MVVALGIRKERDRQDIYTLAQKLLRSGLLGPPQHSGLSTPDPRDNMRFFPTSAHLTVQAKGKF